MKANDNIRKVEDLEDGSSVYEIGDIIDDELESTETSFYDNLALDFPEEGLKKLSSFLQDAIEEDIASRKEWMDSVKKVEPYLGWLIEDIKNVPFKDATRTYDTTLASTLVRFYATVRAELLAPDGPAGFKVPNHSNNDEAIQISGDNQKRWLNFYLTTVDEAFYPDYEKFLIYLGFYGFIVRKVYYDKLLKRPLSRFIMPEDFIIDNDCTSILESNRITHVLHLSKREIILNQQNGIYREVELPYLKSLENDEEELNPSKKDGIDLDAYTKRSLFPVHETHVYLNLEDFKNDNSESDDEVVPLPYIVIRDVISKEVLSIIRNWDENDEQRKRKNYFIPYNYLPGFSIYGIGIAHLIGSNSISSTKILRQLIDAGTFKNFPGGLRATGMKIPNNDLIVGPGQFVEINTGGIPLQEAFMPLPYSDASGVLRELYIDLREQTKELGSISEMAMMDSKEDIPTATAFAFLEVNNRIQSVILRSIHNSFTKELQLINSLFHKIVTDQNYRSTDFQIGITEEDFNNEVIIIPVSDPSTNSLPQRIMRAESVLQTAMQAPELHNMPEVFALLYRAQGLSDDEIGRILKPPVDMNTNQDQPQPVDPNALLMADIQQKEAETAARERMANLKAETDIFKAQLDFEKEKVKIEAQKEMAMLKSETELTKQEVSNGTQ